MRRMGFVFIVLGCLVTGIANAVAPADLVLSCSDIRRAPIFEKMNQLGKGGLDYFWVCAESSGRSLQVRCEDLGVNKLEGPKADLEIKVSGFKLKHHYSLRHAIPSSECRDYLRKFRKLMKKNLPFCLLGAVYDEKKPVFVGGVRELGGVFFELKSALGYVTDMEWDPDYEP